MAPDPRRPDRGGRHASQLVGILALDSESKRRLGRWGLTLGAACGVVAVVATSTSTGLSVEGAADRVRDAGALGIVGYLVAFSLLQPLGLSGHLFVLSAALVWSPWVAFPLALLGALGAALVSFGFARYVAYDWVQARLPEGLRKYEDGLLERGLLGVTLFRLVTFTTHPAMLMMGTLRVPFGRMVLATLLGFAPTVALDVVFGGELLRRVLSLF